MVPILRLSILPVVTLALHPIPVIFVSCKLIDHFFEVKRHMWHIFCLHSLAPFSLLLLETLLFGAGQRIFAFFKCPLIWSQSGVSWWQFSAQSLRQMVQLEREVRKVELLFAFVQIRGALPQLNSRPQRFNRLSVLLQIVTGETVRPGSLDFVTRWALLCHVLLIVVDETLHGVLVLTAPPFSLEFDSSALARLLVIDEHFAYVLHIHRAKNYIVHKCYRSCDLVLFPWSF